MGNMKNVIFYLESWGSKHVLKKVHDIETVPNANEVIVFDNNDSYFTVIERVFDFEEGTVHIRVKENSRTYDLAAF